MRAIVFLMSAAVTAGAAAQSERSDQPLAFAPRLVAAINGKTLDGRRALLHPSSRACITPQTRPYLEDAMSAQFRHAIPPSYRSRAVAIAADRPLPFGEVGEFPLRPTHEVHIDFDTGPNRSTTMVAFLAYSEGMWREVWPCVKPDTVPQMQAAKEARLKQHERVKSLAAAMPQALRADVSRLLAQGRKIDAIRQYQKASGEDLSTAKAVVESITP